MYFITLYLKGVKNLYSKMSYINILTVSKNYKYIGNLEMLIIIIIMNVMLICYYL